MNWWSRFMTDLKTYMKEPIDHLNPELKALVKSLIAVCKTNRIVIREISAYRDSKQQDALYALGRTRSGKIVTNAKGGQSWHNYGLAVDFAIDKESNWDEMGSHARRLGLEWGGNFRSFVDKPHVQLTRGLKIKEASILLKTGGFSSVWNEVLRRKNDG